MNAPVRIRPNTPANMLADHLVRTAIMLHQSRDLAWSGAHDELGDRHHQAAEPFRDEIEVRLRSIGFTSKMICEVFG